MTNQQSLNSRLISVDALRGFALAGIILVHFVEQFIGGMIPQDKIDLMTPGIPDYIVSGILEIFFRGKFFALFSILFGLSFSIQMDNAAKKGIGYSGRFLWRLALLMVFGLIHSMFYRGDILTVYVVVGIFLPLFHKQPDIVIYIVAGLLFLGLGRFVVFMIYGSDGFFGLWSLEPDSPYAQEYYNILKHGSILDVFRDNLTNGLLTKIEFQFGTFNRGYLTLGYFLVGMWFGRIKLFENLSKNRRKIMEFMWYSLAFGLVCIVLAIVQFSQVPQPMDFNTWQVMFAMQTFDLANIGLTGFILALFLATFVGKKGQKLHVLAPYGQTALSSYILQSLIGTFLFYGWGLGLLVEVRNLYTFLIGILIIVIQVVSSKWWMARFKYGPLEWIWRCLTWWKKMPFVRK